jgi:hypothetical protein
VTVEYHWLAGRYDPLPALIADLVRRRVAVIAVPAAAKRPFGGRVSERLCKQVSVSLPYRGDSHDDQYDDYTGVAGSTAR